MELIRLWMDELVDQGRLDRDWDREWEASVEVALERMVTTSGLHATGR